MLQTLLKGNGCCKHLNKGKDWKVEKNFHVTLAKATKDQHLQSPCNPKFFCKHIGGGQTHLHHKLS